MSIEYGLDKLSADGLYQVLVTKANARFQVRKHFAPRSYEDEQAALADFFKAEPEYYELYRKRSRQPSAARVITEADYSAEARIALQQPGVRAGQVAYQTRKSVVPSEAEHDVERRVNALMAVPANNALSRLEAIALVLSENPSLHRRLTDAARNSLP